MDYIFVSRSVLALLREVEEMACIQLTAIIIMDQRKGKN
jgi:hypothetical protein